MGCSVQQFVEHTVYSVESALSLGALWRTGVTVGSPPSANMRHCWGAMIPEAFGSKATLHASKLSDLNDHNPLGARSVSHLDVSFFFAKHANYLKQILGSD